MTFGALILYILKVVMLATGAVVWSAILLGFVFYWTMCFIGWRYEKRRKKKEWNNDE